MAAGVREGPSDTFLALLRARQVPRGVPLLRICCASSTIGRCLSTLDSGTRARMERKFDLYFVMAQQSIPFAKYPALLELKQRHEVDIGHAYNTVDSARELIYICHCTMNTCNHSEFPLAVLISVFHSCHCSCQSVFCCFVLFMLS